jgi:hypothetical protein
MPEESIWAAAGLAKASPPVNAYLGLTEPTPCSLCFGRPYGRGYWAGPVRGKTPWRGTGSFPLPPRRGRLAKANLTLYTVVKFSVRRNVLLLLVDTP